MTEEIIINENEVMENEVEIIEMEPEESGMSGVAKAIIILAVTAVGAGVAWGVKKWNDKRKAKSELRLVEEEDFVEVTDERVEEITK